MSNNNYGTVNYNGVVYTLTEDAHATNYRDGVRYEAHAVNPDGVRCLVWWDILPEYARRWQAVEAIRNGGEWDGEAMSWAAWVDDESNACSWDEPSGVGVIG